MLTSSKSEIIWSLPVSESLKNVENISFSSSKIWVRVIDAGGGLPGYLLNGIDVKTQATSVSVGKVNDHLITISAYKSSGWTTGSINNSPLTVSGSSCVFSLS